VRIWILFILHTVVVMTPGAASAQATPEANRCSVAPLSADELEEIVANGFEPAPTPEAGDPNVPARDWLPILLAVSESVECANANDPMRSLALYTDRYLAERFSGERGADELGHLLAAATRTPVPAAPEDQLVLLGIDQLVRYGDGRLGVLVTTANADSTFTDLLVFARVDEVLQIDQVVLDVNEAATPAANG
jgi:hypothetical protein